MAVPKLVVFDLDMCLWHPEMFELPSSPSTWNKSDNSIIAGSSTIRWVVCFYPKKKYCGNVMFSALTTFLRARLFPGAVLALQELHSKEEFNDTIVAVASSTTEGGYARKVAIFSASAPNSHKTPPAAVPVVVRGLSRRQGCRRRPPRRNRERLQGPTSVRDALEPRQCMRNAATPAEWTEPSRRGNSPARMRRNLRPQLEPRAQRGHPTAMMGMVGAALRAAAQGDGGGVRGDALLRRLQLGRQLRRGERPAPARCSVPCSPVCCPVPRCLLEGGQSASLPSRSYRGRLRSRCHSPCAPLPTAADPPRSRAAPALIAPARAALRSFHSGSRAGR
jgi:hypothetical protein